MVFKPGKSGNPSGKPKGARNKTTVAMEKLLDDDAATITSKAIELAKNGDLTALRLCLERIIPPRKDRPVNFDMPEIKTPSDALVAATAIMRAVAGGDLTPSEAAELSKTIDSFVRVAETADLAERIKRLEQVADNR
jgi:ribosomal protein L17